MIGDDAAELLTTDQLCRLLNISRRTLYSLPVPVPRVQLTAQTIRYRRGDVEAWIAAHSAA